MQGQDAIGHCQVLALQGARFASLEGKFVSYRLPTRLLAALCLLLVPSLAHAHAILEDSTPVSGGSIAAGPIDLRLRYNSRIDQGRSRLTLTKPDRSRETVAITPDQPPDMLAAHLVLQPGDYVLRWQVLAVDGHITRGDVPFTVTGH